MKKLFTLFVLLACLNAKAQYVTIPDANFVAWLQTEVPSAMNGNQMDTTDLAVTTLTVMNVSTYPIHDLKGVRYFDFLKELVCSGNSYLDTIPTLPGVLERLDCSTCFSIVHLPVLPGTLKYLDCANNLLTSLPALPNLLEELHCFGNQINALPSLPGSLTILDCDHNNISIVPVLPATLLSLDISNNQVLNLPSLPGSLVSLNCYYNQISSLPALPNSLSFLDCGTNQIAILPSLPAFLSHLACSHNLLTALPVLPANLESLSCDDNSIGSLPVLPNSILFLSCSNLQLTSLPVLPNSLTYFDCSFNQLTSIPVLPPGLDEFYCSYNLLPVLPNLPAGLSILGCRNNQLTNLPTLPGTLVTLECQNNNINCFYAFPASISNINISNNPFTCLPNYLVDMDAATLTYPLCTSTSTCPSAQGIYGHVYKDSNNNCMRDAGDTDLNNVHLKLYDVSGNLLGHSYSAFNGIYSFPQTSGTYTVVVDTASLPLVPSCASPGIDSTVTVAVLDTNINFSYACANFDVGVESIYSSGIFFPGHQSTINLVAGDLSQIYNYNCASGISGSLVFSVNGPVTYVGPASGALTPLVSGNVYTYTIPDFGLINTSSAFRLVFQTDTTALSGDTVCVTALVTPTSGDYNPSNNNYNFCFDVINSFDPNMKEVYPVNVMPGYHDWFTYTIHFQNTGSAPAMDVELRDILDNQLDVETFEVIAYSHPTLINLTGNVLNVRFPNIMLADSTSDFDGSIGYIQYRIKPKASWQAPYVIENTASIYFDYNAPIVTNTTYNSIMTVTGVGEQKENKVKLYPNPTNTTFTIELSTKEKQSLLLYDITGNCVLSQTIENGKGFVDASHLAPGIYNVSIKGTGSVINKKLVIVK
jgi:uncharacterized repeat protein (TIGR01451 family)